MGGRRGAERGGAGRERGERAGARCQPGAPHAPSSLQRARGCSGGAGAHGVGAHGPGWHADTGAALAPGGGVSGSAHAATPRVLTVRGLRGQQEQQQHGAEGGGGPGRRRHGEAGDRRPEPGTGAGSARGQSAGEAAASRGRRGAVAPVIL